MNTMVNGLLIQVACYGGLMIFTIVAIAFFMRGFFWEYFKVRTSFGKNVLIKIRTPLRDHYKVGWVDENFLCYKTKEFTIRMAIRTEDKTFYRSMGITWVDVDEEKNAICKADYTTATGFDAKKHSDLLTRALMRPTITSSQEKIILICVIITMFLVIVSVFFAFKANQTSAMVLNSIPGMLKNALESAKGIAGTGVTGIVNATNVLS